MVTMDAIWPQSLKYLLPSSLQKKSVDPRTKTKDSMRRQQYVVHIKGPQPEKMSTDLAKSGRLWKYGMNDQVWWWEKCPQHSCLSGWEW